MQISIQLNSSSTMTKRNMDINITNPHSRLLKSNLKYQSSENDLTAAFLIHYFQN